MTEQTIEKLSSLIHTIISEQKILKKQISDHKQELEDIYLIIDKFKEGEDSDFSIFSPRKIESVYSDEIKNKREEASVLEKTIEHDQTRYDQLEEQKEFFQSIVDDYKVYSEKELFGQSRMEELSESFEQRIDDLKKDYESKMQRISSDYERQLFDLKRENEELIRQKRESEHEVYGSVSTERYQAKIDEVRDSLEKLLVVADNEPHLMKSIINSMIHILDS